MLTRELLRKIRTIEIVTERLVRDRMAGQYHSVFKGAGIAFSEVRQYIPGDDIRLIDWNVSARMNAPYIKLYVEEREMTVLLLVDMSASGRFGSVGQEKRELLGVRHDWREKVRNGTHSMLGGTGWQRPGETMRAAFAAHPL